MAKGNSFESTDWSASEATSNDFEQSILFLSRKGIKSIENPKSFEITLLDDHTVFYDLLFE